MSSLELYMWRLQINFGKLVLVSTTSIVLLFGSIDFYWIRSQTYKALVGEMKKRAVHHSRSVAVEAVDAIVLEDQVLLRRLLDEALSTDPEVAYMFVVGPHGELLAHTFREGFPAELLSANPLPADRDYMARRIVDKQGREKPMIDVVAPIAGGSAGFAHVGLREDLISAGVLSVSHAVTGMVATFVLLGILASLMITRVASQPLLKLEVATRRVNLEALSGSESNLADLLPKLSSRIGLTEVDRLTEEFRQMVQRLSDACRQLEKTREQLVFAERLSTLGAIAAGLAHELNNPLAGLRNCLRRIRREPDDREQFERYVSVMQESVDRMQGTLQGLLALAKPRHPRRRAVSLEPLLQRVLLLASDRLTEARVIANKQLDPSALVVWADEHLLEETLLNLVLNACDSLSDRKQREPEFSPELAVRAFRRDGQFCIEVQDNGVGIKAEDLPRLFDPFFTTKSRGQGTGLGLSIARDSIRAHGGDILVESELGEGAVFRVLLQDSAAA